MSHFLKQEKIVVKNYTHKNVFESFFFTAKKIFFKIFVYS